MTTYTSTVYVCANGHPLQIPVGTPVSLACPVWVLGVPCGQALRRTDQGGRR